MPPSPVGRTWPAHTYEVGLEKVREYADAVGEVAAHHHDREAAAEAGFEDVVAPPCFSAVFCAPAVGAAIFDPAVGLFDPAVGIASYRFVHKAQLFRWHRPVYVGDVVTTRARLVAADHDRAGRVRRVFESESVGAGGDAIVSARYEGVVPDRGGGGRRPWQPGQPPAAGREPADLRRPEPGDALPELALTPDRYAPIRYAGASRDFTPFHLDAEAARAVGLEGIILHGLYTLAQAARAHTAPFGGDPRVLRSLSGRFRRPAVPERELVVTAAVRERRQDGSLLTCGEVRQDGVPVIAELEGRLAPSG